MKIFSAAQTRALDTYTIQHEPIASIALMERASMVFSNWFIHQFLLSHRPAQIFCGIGNNGGDGLAVARLLEEKQYKVELICCKISTTTSEDFQKNLQRLPKQEKIPIINLKKGDAFPTIKEDAIIIDAIFGSGLNRPVEGYWSKLLEYLNQNATTIVAIDVPSGLFADKPSTGTTIKANYTLSFELPKLAFLFAENYETVGEWTIKSIGLHTDFIKKTPTNYFYTTAVDVKPLLKKRKKFGHKGNYGHALLIVGSYGKVGAAILAAKACLRSGAGLLSVHIPKCAYEIVQMAFPEAMVVVDQHQYCFSKVETLEPYKAIGVGCGLGMNQLSEKALLDLMEKANIPLVLDADALNILAKNPDWLLLLPKNSILSPHPKEFERLFGKSSNHFERLDLQRHKAQELGVFILLKGANTCIAAPDGKCYFNSTGNPGMGTAGTGDVLTGIITGLLAQSYIPLEAAILGVYLHGLAGDIAAAELEQEALLASDVIQYLGKAYKSLFN